MAVLTKIHQTVQHSTTIMAEVAADVMAAMDKAERSTGRILPVHNRQYRENDSYNCE